MERTCSIEPKSSDQTLRMINSQNLVLDTVKDLLQGIALILELCTQ